MNELTSALPWVLVGLMILAVLAALRRPLQQAAGLLGRTAAGLAALAVFGHVGPLMGVTLGVNLVNALILGVLGLPGFGLLLMLHWVSAV